MIRWHFFCALSAFFAGAGIAGAAEVVRLSEANWDSTVPAGKEVDSIYGDWVLRNDRLVAVIADAIPGRNANMTVRNVGGAVIDLTVRDPQSDQLSAYYPLAIQYALSGPFLGPGSSESARPGDGKSVSLTFRGPATDKQSTAEVTYTLEDGARWLTIITRVTNSGSQPLDLKLADAIRADGEFEFGKADPLGLFWAYDAHWRQCYGVLVKDGSWHFALDDLKDGDRPELRIEKRDVPAAPLAAGESRETTRYLFPAADAIETLALARQLRNEPLVNVDILVNDPDGPVADADVAVQTAAGEPIAHAHTDTQGRLVARLPAGAYQAVVSAQGRGQQTIKLDATKAGRQEVQLPAPGYVVAKISSPGNGATACKVQFRGRNGTADPKFGPDSAIHGVRNAYYTENGMFRVALTPGEYDVIVSHGPEFDAVFTSIVVAAGKEAQLAAELKRTVDTTGWLSADFHSHSTPSGDNTASQRGRVLNLLAEHVEVAPCTEHNRITVYDEHLKHFDAVARMLTCPGMELTGRPLPINHQNAFPLVQKPRTQDGGGPQSDVDPVVQIERLAMWDNKSDKLVQINHPNIVQMVGDKDLNGSPDGGFEKMFSFVDVIEVHPLDRIFSKPDSLPGPRDEPNTMFNWLQLMNLGYRVPGVVNTDAHWNFHGSGFLRNYIKSPTDDPAQAKVPELVHTCEHGNITMTNGPFLEVAAKADQADDTADVGDDLSAPGGKLHLKVRVQCPNWIEVNRVQVFVNGKPKPEWNYARASHPKMFHPGNVLFAEDLALSLDADAHLVVACTGEGKGLGPVVGPDHEKDVPTAVSNPIFVDVDGDGFEPNGDTLGLPLPIEPGAKPSKPHRHKHPH